MTNTQIVHVLREQLNFYKYDGVLLPLTDEYQGEYSAPYARRVTWLTGFDGSAGMVIILPTHAALLTDGRYTLQAAREVNTDIFTIYNSAEMNTTAYLKAYAREGAIIGYDPWLHSVKQIATLKAELMGYVTLMPISPNPIDALWQDQPSRPCAPIFRHEDALAGKTSTDKIAQTVARMKANALLITEPEALCWLLNIRGGDVPFNPLPLCYGVLHNTGEVSLIINPDKVIKGVLDAHITLIDEADIAHSFKPNMFTSLQYDPATCPIWFKHQLESAGIPTLEATNPITLLKAIKNPVEQENTRQAHRVDGASVQKFLRWFEAIPTDATITELEIVSALEGFRREHPDYRGASFATIAGAGEHGAIVHYHATEATNRTLAMGQALLVDSGGQYPYGTTDITRTLFRGVPSPAFKHHFTLVLKGHIALATAIFPEGTTGHQLDVLARQYLWAEGLDYQHGTGHGVGHYLCVHEGPQSISTRAGGAALQAGMILSNEPGYYEEGAYGIRIESLVLVVEKNMRERKGEAKRFFGFETLTRAPIDPLLVDDALMTDGERTWLKEYNEAVIG